jgi:hypothetical protein
MAGAITQKSKTKAKPVVELYRRLVKTEGFSATNLVQVSPRATAEQRF